MSRAPVRRRERTASTAAPARYHERSAVSRRASGRGRRRQNARRARPAAHTQRRLVRGGAMRGGQLRVPQAQLLPERRRPVVAQGCEGGCLHLEPVGDHHTSRRQRRRTVQRRLGDGVFSPRFFHLGVGDCVELFRLCRRVVDVAWCPQRLQRRSAWTRRGRRRARATTRGGAASTAREEAAAAAAAGRCCGCACDGSGSCIRDS